MTNQSDNRPEDELDDPLAQHSEHDKPGHPRDHGDERRVSEHLAPQPTEDFSSEPLPESSPKPSVDDPLAPARIQRLLDSPAYRPADQDPDFLQRDELRHARLQLEYLKVELSLQAQNVRSTIVLFGSTRIPEPSAALRDLARARTELEVRPDDVELQRALTAAQRRVARSNYYDIARQFARRISTMTQADHGPRDLVICTGGGPGIMEAGNRGAHDVDRVSIGLNIDLPLEQFPNPYITPELCFKHRYFALRKLHFLKRAAALVAFPGGFGTLDEIFDALCLIQTRRMPAIPIVLVGREFWSRVIDFEFLAQEGMIARGDLEIFTYADSVDEICSHVAHFASGCEIIESRT